MKGDESSPAILRMNAVTRVDRLACTAAVREIIVTACRGWIGDFYQYSNTSLCLHFEIPVSNLALLRDRLIAASLRLSNGTQQAAGTGLVKETESSTIACTLQITFIHNEPDLRRYVPPIPG